MRVVIAELNAWEMVMSIVYDVTLDAVVDKMEHHQYNMTKDSVKNVVDDNGVIYWYIGQIQYCAMNIDYKFEYNSIDRFIFDQLKPLIREQKINDLIN
jgi:hypothetical protein